MNYTQAMVDYCESVSPLNFVIVDSDDKVPSKGFVAHFDGHTTVTLSNIRPICAPDHAKDIDTAARVAHEYGHFEVANDWMHKGRQMSKLPDYGLREEGDTDFAHMCEWYADVIGALAFADVFWPDRPDIATLDDENLVREANLHHLYEFNREYDYEEYVGFLREALG